MSSTSGLRSGNLLNELARPKYGPPCECHGEPQVWNHCARMKAGGNWMCAVRRREINRASHKRTTAKLRKTRRRKSKVKVARQEKSLAESREMWKQRALAAEWGLKQHVRMTYKNEPHAGENGVKMRTQKIGDTALADRTVAA